MVCAFLFAGLRRRPRGSTRRALPPRCFRTICRAQVENADPAIVSRSYIARCQRREAESNPRVCEYICQLTLLDLVEQPNWTQAFVNLSRAS